MFYFHIYSVQCIFNVIFIFLEIFSLTHRSLRSVWFNFQLFWDFPIIFLLFISGLISLWSRNKLYGFNYFKFIEVSFMAIWSILLCSTDACKECTCFLLLGRVFYKCQLNPVGWWDWFLYIFADILSSGSISFLEWGGEVLSYNYRFICFSFHLSFASCILKQCAYTFRNLCLFCGLVILYNIMVL